MAAPKIAIRLGIDGKPEFLNDLQDIGTKGNATFGDVQKAADAATAAITRQGAAMRAVNAEMSRTPTRASAGQIDSLLGIGASAAPSAVDSARTFAPAYFRAAEQGAQKLRAQLDPLYGAQMSYNKAVSEADKYLAAGTINQAQHAAAVAMSKKALDDATKAHEAHGAAVKFNGAQVNEFTGIIRHSFDALMSGANPLTVLSQHAASAVQALGSGEGGLAGGLAAVTSGAAPAIAAVVAVAAATAVAAKATLDYEKANSNLSLALSGIGGATGLTSRQLEQMAEQQSAAAKIGIGAARDQEAAYLRMGVMNTNVLSHLSLVTKEYALAENVDMKSAAQALGTALEHPAEGAKMLGAQLGGLTSATYLHIEALQQQNKVMEAQGAVFDYAANRLAGTEDKVTGLKKVVDDLTTSLSNMYAQLGKKIDFAIDYPGGKASPDDIVGQYRKQQSQGLGSQVWDDAKSFRFGILGFGAHTLLNPSISSDAYQKALADQMVDWNKTQISGAKTRAAALDLDAQNDQDKAFPQQARLRDMSNTIKAIQSRLLDPLESAAAHANDLKTLTADQAQYDRAKRRLDEPKAPGAAHAEELQRDAEAMDTNIAQSKALADAYLQSDAAAIKADATRKAMTAATKQGADVDAAVARQIQLAIADQEVSAAKLAATDRDHAAVQQNVNALVASGAISYRDMTEQLKLEQAIAPARVAMTLADAAGKERLQKAIDGVTAAMKASKQATDEATVLADIGKDDDETRRLQFETTLIGENTAARRAALAVYDGQKTAKDLNLNGTDTARLVQGARTRDAAQTGLDNGQARADMDRANATDLTLAQRKLELVGQTDAVRQLELDKLKVAIDLQEKYGADAAGMIATQQRQLELMDQINREYDRQKQAIDDVKQLGESALDSVNDLVKKGDENWRDWRDAGVHAIMDVVDEAFKLQIINPIKNAAFGDNLPTGATQGSMIDRLLHAGGSGSSTMPGAAPLAAYDPTVSSITMPAYDYSPPPQLPPGFAGGTENAPGGWSWVGEDGPELRYLNAGDIIRSNVRSRQMMGESAGHTFVFNVAPGVDPQEFVKALRPHMEAIAGRQAKIEINNFSRHGLSTRMGQISHKLGK